MDKVLLSFFFLAFSFNALAVDQETDSSEQEDSIDDDDALFSINDLIILYNEQFQAQVKFNTNTSYGVTAATIIAALTGLIPGLDLVVTNCSASADSTGCIGGIASLVLGIVSAILIPAPTAVNYFYTKSKQRELADHITDEVIKSRSIKQSLNEDDLWNSGKVIMKERHKLLKKLSFEQALVLSKLDFKKFRTMVDDIWFSDKVALRFNALMSQANKEAQEWADKIGSDDVKNNTVLLQTILIRISEDKPLSTNISGSKEESSDNVQQNTNQISTNHIPTQLNNIIVDDQIQRVKRPALVRKKALVKKKPLENLLDDQDSQEE